MMLLQNEAASTFDVQLLLSELKACTRTRNLQRGKQLHAKAAECGHHSALHVANTLINMYAKCSRMPEAREVFDRMKERNVVSWNALILGYAKQGQGDTALDLFTKMKSDGPAPSSVTLVAALKACTSVAEKGAAEKCRNRGKEIHELAIDKGWDSDVYLQSTLIDMYSKSGSMVEARTVFDNMRHPDVVSWTALVLGYADNGQGIRSLALFTRMRNTGCSPNSVTFLAALKACTSLAASGSAQFRDLVKQIAVLVVENGFNSDIKVQSSLIDMYAKWGSMAEARQVFDSMKHPDVVIWSTLILGYADNGQGLTALDYFRKMKNAGPAPDSVTFVAALKACTSISVAEGASGWAECRERGREVHEQAINCGCDSDRKVQCTLIDMYSKCGSMVDARQVFDRLDHPDVVTWSVLILGYADNGQGLNALELFMQMRSEGPAPNSITFLAVLKACGLVGGLEFGRTVHSEIDRSNELDAVLVTCLVDFYARCGSLAEARRVFELHADARDIVTWTALLTGLSSSGDHESAFALFEDLEAAGLHPDSVTFLCLLTCCSHAGLVAKGKEFFDKMSRKYAIAPSIEHYNCMVDIFGRANRLDDAMALLDRMPCSPEDVTWKTILGACRKWKNAGLGRLAFQSLISSNDTDAGAYALMGQIFGSRGMLQEQAMVMRMRKKSKAWRKPGEACWTNEVGEVHTFVVL